MRCSVALTFLISSLPATLGDVLFTSPAAGVPVPGGTSFTVAWKESGVAPAIVDLTAYQLFLYSGSNAQPQQLFPLKNAAFTPGVSSVTVTVPIGTGGPGANV